MKVLVVEDDPSVRETLGMVLEAYHHESVLARDGHEAFEYLSHDWPEVMLLDLTLPVLSGEEVFAEIQRRFGRVPPTVVLSAAQSAKTRAERMRGAFFLEKPYTIEQLMDVLYQASQAKGAA